jgi:amidophosphoribosyltransferase
MPNHDIDVVIPVPDSGRYAALQMASTLGVDYREGFVKNRYIGRTFIMPGQAERLKSVRRKLNAIPREFEGKNVMLVDDSIVRGNTSAQIVDMAREAGANKVYFASAAPPVRFPNVYGIDMPATTEFIANGRTIEEICETIGANRLFYQSLDDLIEVTSMNGEQEWDTSCFSGEYVTGDVSSDYLEHLEATRNDLAKTNRVHSDETIGMHNDE